MKFVVKDSFDREYDVEAPEGTDMEAVLKMAKDRLGVKVTLVGGEGAAPAAAKSAPETDSRDEELERLRGELESERKRGESSVADERTRHAETHRARMKALDRAESSVIASLQRALDSEREAREKAEKRASDAKPVIVENKLPDTKRTAWTITVTSRDANGFVRAMEATPK